MQELGIPSSRINGRSRFFGTSGLTDSGIAFPDKSRDFIAHFFPTWVGTFGIPGAFPHFSPFPQGFWGFFWRIPDLNPTPNPILGMGFKENFGMGEKRF